MKLVILAIMSSSLSMITAMPVPMDGSSRGSRRHGKSVELPPVTQLSSLRMQASAPEYHPGRAQSPRAPQSVRHGPVASAEESWAVRSGSYSARTRSDPFYRDSHGTDNWREEGYGQGLGWDTRSSLPFDPHYAPAGDSISPHSKEEDAALLQQMQENSKQFDGSQGGAPPFFYFDVNYGGLVQNIDGHLYGPYPPEYQTQMHGTQIGGPGLGTIMGPITNAALYDDYVPPAYPATALPQVPGHHVTGSEDTLRRNARRKAQLKAANDFLRNFDALYQNTTNDQQRRDLMRKKEHSTEVVSRKREKDEQYNRTHAPILNRMFIREPHHQNSGGSGRGASSRRGTVRREDRDRHNPEDTGDFSQSFGQLRLD
jgi:hypothetical protein